MAGNHAFITQIVAPAANLGAPPVAVPVLPPTSNHFALLLSCGHIAGATAAMLAGNVHVPQHLRVAVAIVQHQRQYMNNYLLFFAQAACLLTGENPDGMTEEDGRDQYITSDAFVDDLVAAALSAMGGAGFVPSAVRVDMYFTTESVNGDVPDDEMVTVATGPMMVQYYHVPLVRKGLNVACATHQLLVENMRDRRDDFVRYLDELPDVEDSDRVLGMLVGAVVWATPTEASVFGHGTVETSGVVDVSRGDGSDQRCILRAILAGLDPYVRAETDATAWEFARVRYQGAKADVNAAEKARALKYTDEEEDPSPAALSAAVTGIDVATELARQQRVPLKGPEMTARQREPYRTRSVTVRVNKAVELALKGQHAVVNGAHPFFLKAQPINAVTVEFIRAQVPAVAVQFWGRTVQGGASLNYRDPRATLDFLNKGGIVLNLLCSDGHVVAMKSLTTVCARIRASNQRIMCSLCGMSFPHRDDRALTSQRTLLWKHAATGCPVRDPIRMPPPLSLRNLRQLTARESRARWPSRVVAYCDVAPVSSGSAATSTKTAFVLVVGLDLPVWLRAGPRPVDKTRFLLPRLSDTTAVASLTETLERFSFGSLMGTSTTTVISDLYLQRLQPFFDARVSEPWTLDIPDVFEELTSQPVANLLLSVVNSWSPILYPKLINISDTDKFCDFCHLSLSQPSRWQQQIRHGSSLSVSVPPPTQTVHDNEESDVESVDGYAGLDTHVPDSDHELHETVVSMACPVTGNGLWVHKDCCKAATRPDWGGPLLTIDVASDEALKLLLSLACLPKSIASFGGVPPTVQMGGSPETVRGFRCILPIMYDTRTRKPSHLNVFFRGPAAFVATLDKKPPVVATPADVLAAAHKMFQWADKEHRVNGLFPLAFPTRIAASRALLLDTDGSTPIPTSLVSHKSLEFYSRMTQSGRMVTGSAVVTVDQTAPKDPSAPRTDMITYLDVRAMYPAMLLHNLPCQEHTDHAFQLPPVLDDAMTLLMELNPDYPGSPIVSVEVSGHWPASTHEHLRQFPPTFSRVLVTPDMWTPFQRLRFGISKAAPPQARVVAHFLPVVKHPVFVFELQRWVKLGFEVTALGEARSCHGARWAAKFAIGMQKTRMYAEQTGDTALAASVKICSNSAIGSLTLRTQDHTVLKSVLTEDLAVETPLETGSKRAREGKTVRRIKHANDVHFTGRVFRSGDVTFIEKTLRSTVHTGQTVAGLAVRARARCAQLDMFYGFQSRPGILSIFPGAVVLYANIDSIVAKVSLPEHLRYDPTPGSPRNDVSLYTDVRVALHDKLKHMMDPSNSVDIFSRACFTCPQQQVDLNETASKNGGQWGFVRDDTGGAEINALVVNAPNRWAFKLCNGSTTLKGLPEHLSHTSIGRYIADWVGGVLPEDGEPELDTGSHPGPRSSSAGTCKWGNRACVVAPSGKQWPFGCQVQECLDALADTAVVSDLRWD